MIKIWGDNLCAATWMMIMLHFSNLPLNHGLISPQIWSIFLIAALTGYIAGSITFWCHGESWCSGVKLFYNLIQHVGMLVSTWKLCHGVMNCCHESLITWPCHDTQVCPCVTRSHWSFQPKYSWHTALHSEFPWHTQAALHCDIWGYPPGHSPGQYNIRFIWDIKYTAHIALYNLVLI